MCTQFFGTILVFCSILVLIYSQQQADCNPNSINVNIDSSRELQDSPPSSTAGFINPGTPRNIDKNFDCLVRTHAWKYGQRIQPRHGNFTDLFDALQLSACNVTRPVNSNQKYQFKRNVYQNESPTKETCVFYINPVYGSDANNGTLNAPFKSILQGIIATRQFRSVKNYSINNNETKCVLNLMEGIHYLNESITLNSNDSYLTIQSYNRQKVIISGGIPLVFDDSWILYQYKAMNWTTYKGYTNVYETFTTGKSNDLVKYLGIHSSFDSCLERAINTTNMGTFYSVTYFDEFYSDSSNRQHCYGVVDISWAPVKDLNATTAKYEGRNIWYNKIKNNVSDIFGLRINYSNKNTQERAIRARYPNQNPETSMQYYSLSGWITYPTIWFQPNISLYNFTDIIIKAEDYPNVIWPMDGPGNTNWTGEGAWGNFFQGKGGLCVNKFISPDYGYWCSGNAPRNGNPINPYPMEHSSPYGLIIDPISIINSNQYTSELLSTAIIHAWRPEHWFTWMWDIQSYNSTSGELLFNNGGFQGAEGYNKSPYGGEWYIENIFIELDSPNEWFYNKSNSRLYYYYNSTDNAQKPPPNSIQFIATNLKILFMLNGTQSNPILNMTFRDLEFRDTSYTYMDIHGFPSGGDWAIQRQGSITVYGTEHLNINSCVFSRLDGIGIFLNGYNRDAIIENNDFEFIGETAIASWGYTLGKENINKLLEGGGPDGRDGTQPRNTIIRSNLIREIGIWQKQSAFWFQAQTCQTVLENNIFFNGPRAAININDGFGGNNSIYGNLLLNSCRESGDHGPFNSWDRVPYITTVANGYTASIIPGYNDIHNNFIIGTYQSLACIDTDDGSNHYKIYNNFFVYSNIGMKSDFSGHNLQHYNNVYGYIHHAWIFWCGGANNIFSNNSILSNSNQVYTSNCNIPVNKGTTNFTLYNTTLYLPNPNEVLICGMSFNDWQMLGNDLYSTINQIIPGITNQYIVELGMTKLD